MQDQHLTVLDAQLTQRLVNSLSIFLSERWLLGLVEIFELCFLGFLACVLAANAIDRNVHASRSTSKIAAHRGLVNLRMLRKTLSQTS